MTNNGNQANGQQNGLLRIELERNQDGVFLYLKGNAELEQLFHTEQIRESRACHTVGGRPLKYYSWEGYSPQQQRTLRDIAAGKGGSIGDYGEGLLLNGMVNFSILRSVGLKDGIRYKLPDTMYSPEFMEDWVKKTKSFTKDVYQQFLKKIRITCVITIEEL